MRDLFISCEIFGTPRTHLKHHVPREAILLDVVWEVGEGIESLTIIYQDCFDFQVEAKCPLYSEGLIQKWCRSSSAMRGRRLTAVPLLGDIYYRYICIPHTLAGQKLCFLSRPTANPFPLESFCQHDSGQFPPRKRFLVKFKTGWFCWPCHTCHATQNGHDWSRSGTVDQARTVYIGVLS